MREHNFLKHFVIVGGGTLVNMALGFPAIHLIIRVVNPTEYGQRDLNFVFSKKEVQFMPKVSVIIPIYNVESYLDECVDSVRNQTLSDIEIILVDDGSPDRCPEMCDAYAAKDPRIRVRHQKNEGVSVARNNGIQMATADWIMFVDPDDWLESDAVEILYQKAEANQCEIVFAGHYINSEHHESLPEGNGNAEYETLFEQDAIRSLCQIMFGIISAKRLPPEFWSSFKPLYKKYKIGTPWAKLYNKNHIKLNRISFPEGMHPDEDMLFNLYYIYTAKRVCFKNKPVYHYRIWAGAVMQRFSPDRGRNHLYYIKCLRQFIYDTQEVALEPLYYIGVVRSIVAYSGHCCNHICSLHNFRERISAFKAFVKEPPCREAIQSVDISLLRKKLQIVVILLRLRMYSLTMLMFYVWRRLKPVR